MLISRGLFAAAAAAAFVSPALAQLTITSQRYDRSVYSPATGLLESSTAPAGPGLYSQVQGPLTYSVVGLQFPSTQVFVSVTDTASNRATSSWTATSLNVRTAISASRVLNSPNIAADWREADSRVLSAVNADISFTLAAGSLVDLAYGRSSLTTSGSVTPFNVGRTLQLQSLDGLVTYWTAVPPVATGTLASTNIFLPAGDYRVRFGTGLPLGAEALVNILPGDLAMAMDFSMVVPSPGVLVLAGASGIVALRRRRA